MKGHFVVKFGTVGVLNTIVDIIVFTAILNLTPAPAYIAQGAGYGAGMLNSFVMNKMWTFRKFDTENSLAGEILRFFTVNAFSLAISMNVMRLLSDVLGISAIVSKSAVVILTQFINYTGYKFWVFNG